MRKTRLTKYSRERLCALARYLVKVPDADLKKAHTAASLAVRTLITTKYPPEDMAVLRRYNLGREDRCVRLRLRSGGDYQFNLSKDEPGVWHANSYCHMHLADEATTLTVEAFRKVETIHEELVEKKLEPYYKLINGSATFEAVLEIWPEAEQVRSQCGASATALVGAVTAEVVAAIQVDMASRAVA